MNESDLAFGLKRCSRCQERKPVSGFHKAPRNVGGLQSWCRACMREYGQSRRPQAKPQRRVHSRADWRRLNPPRHYPQPAERLRGYQAARAARVTRAPGRASKTQVADRAAMFGNKCAYCPFGEYETIDHVIPLARGGSNWPANLRPCCVSCGSSKGSKTLPEWVDRIWDFKERMVVGMLASIQLLSPCSSDSPRPSP